MHDSDFSALEWQKRRFGDLDERRREGRSDSPFVSILRWAVVAAVLLSGAVLGLLLGAHIRGF